MKLLRTIWEFWWLKLTLPLKIVVLLVLLLAVLVPVLLLRGKKAPSIEIDEENLQKVNSQNEATRKKELEQIIYENQEVIKTIDERSNVAEINRVEKEREIKEKIDAVDKKIEAAKSQGKDITSEELEKLLLGEK